MAITRGIGWLVGVVLVWATLAIAWQSYMHRYTTNTAGGRFYRTDHLRGVTLCIDKDGTSRQF